MKSLKARFTKVQTKYPLYTSVLCFYHAVINQGFSRKVMAQWFNKFVEKEDYAQKEKKAILANLREVTKRLEEGIKSTQTHSQGNDLRENHVR